MSRLVTECYLLHWFIAQNKAKFHKYQELGLFAKSKQVNVEVYCLQLITKTSREHTIKWTITSPFSFCCPYNDQNRHNNREKAKEE